MVDRVQIPDINQGDLPDELTDSDLFVIRDISEGEDFSIPFSLLINSLFGSAATLDVGEYEDNVVVLEDVGGTPGLPAVDGSRLQNLPDQVDEGMNEGQISYKATIVDMDPVRMFGHQFGVSGTPIFEAALTDLGTGSDYAFSISPPGWLNDGRGFYLDIDGGGNIGATIDVEGFTLRATQSFFVDTPAINFSANLNTISFNDVQIDGVRNIEFDPQSGTVSFNDLDLQNYKNFQVTLSGDTNITSISNITPFSHVYLKVTNGNGGGWEITGWPTELVWANEQAPVLSDMYENDERIIHLYFDGVTIFGWYEFGSGSGGDLSASEIKSLYESNPDTNAFTDEDADKLDLLQVNDPINLDILDSVVDSLFEDSLRHISDWDIADGMPDEYADQNSVFRILNSQAPTFPGANFDFIEGEYIIAHRDNPTSSAGQFSDGWSKLIDKRNAYFPDMSLSGFSSGGSLYFDCGLQHKPSGNSPSQEYPLPILFTDNGGRYFIAKFTSSQQTQLIPEASLGVPDDTSDVGLYLYACYSGIDNTIELGISASLVKESQRISTVAIDEYSNDSNTIYTASDLTLCNIRLLGKILADRGYGEWSDVGEEYAVTPLMELPGTSESGPNRQSGTLVFSSVGADTNGTTQTITNNLGTDNVDVYLDAVGSFGAGADWLAGFKLPNNRNRMITGHSGLDQRDTITTISTPSAGEVAFNVYNCLVGSSQDITIYYTIIARE